MPALIRNLAISGVKTVGDLRFIEYICEDIAHPAADLSDTTPLPLSYQNRVVYDDGNNSAFMYSWGQQSYSHCTLMPMAEFRRKYRTKPL